MPITASCPFSNVSRLGLRGLICVLLIGLVAACGFRLKGTTPLPFDTLYTNIDANSAFGSQLQRLIVATSPNTRFVSDVTQADARLNQISLHQSMREISISPEGLVEEYELNLEFVFSLTDAQGRVLLPPTALRTTREIPYDPNAIQAKQGEISSVFQEMQRSLIDRIVRRLTSPEVIEAYQHRESQPVDEEALLSQPPSDDAVVPDPGLNALPMPDMVPGY